MFLFVITDLYDLNNTRVLVDFLSRKNLPVCCYFLLTPLKPYRQVFLTNKDSIITKVDMSVFVEKHCGTIEQFNNWIKCRQIDYTFICCSYYPLFKRIGFFTSISHMGDICMLSWGFDGCDDPNYEAYKVAKYVFAEGPFFFSRKDSRRVVKDWSHKIKFSHPYYDVFNNYNQYECRNILGIPEGKKVLLIAETGNIKDIEKKWFPLYHDIIKKVPRDIYYIVFKARQKMVRNPCKKLVSRYVDKYIENEWLFPPCSAVSAIASDICVLPCESRYVLECVMSKKPTILYTKSSFKNKKATNFFGDLVSTFKFNSWSYLSKEMTSHKADHNYSAALNWSVTMQSGGNCEYILKTVTGK